MVALMVHDAADGGVDVERLGRVTSMSSVARTVFAPVERDELLALGEEQREARFYRLWTLKEAFAKATGRGLSLPLRDISFSGGGGDEEPITLGCREAIEPQPSAWAFTVRQPSPRHVLATASRSAGGRPPREVELFRVGLR
jgi:4'-phosphopantetheinyl transferase